LYNLRLFVCPAWVQSRNIRASAERVNTTAGKFISLAALTFRICCRLYVQEGIFAMMIRDINAEAKRDALRWAAIQKREQQERRRDGIAFAVSVAVMYAGALAIWWTL